MFATLRTGPLICFCGEAHGSEARGHTRSRVRAAHRCMDTLRPYHSCHQRDGARGGVKPYRTVRARLPIKA